MKTEIFSTLMQRHDAGDAAIMGLDDSARFRVRFCLKDDGSIALEQVDYENGEAWNCSLPFATVSSIQQGIDWIDAHA